MWTKSVTVLNPYEAVVKSRTEGQQSKPEAKEK